MKTIDGSMSCNLVIGTDTIISGIVTGSVFVQAGATLLLKGMVTGNLFLEAGGEANIAGMVAGTIFDKGGDLRVRGLVGEVMAYA
jgi:hypothetical protein